MISVMRTAHTRSVTCGDATVIANHDEKETLQISPLSLPKEPQLAFRGRGGGVKREETI